MKQHYYETFCGVYSYAHDTLEEAIDFADKNECTFIAEIGGSWDEYLKCSFCGEWYPSYDINTNGDCSRCVQAITDHNGGYNI